MGRALLQYCMALESRARTCVQPVQEPAALPLSYFEGGVTFAGSWLVVKGAPGRACLSTSPLAAWPQPGRDALLPRHAPARVSV